MANAFFRCLSVAKGRFATIVRFTTSFLNPALQLGRWNVDLVALP
jgi:hypothetical protein